MSCSFIGGVCTSSRRGMRHHARLEIFAVDIEPRRDSLALRQVARLEHHRVLVHVLLQRDFLAHLHEIARDIHLLALHANVPVQHELPRLRPRSRQSHAINHVVEPPLEHDHQVRAGGALHAHRLLEVRAELPLEQAVGALHLLLFAQLHAVAHHLRAARLAVLSWNEIALLDRALFRKTPEAFQEKLLPFPAAQPANRFTMSCQVLLLLEPYFRG